MSPCLTTSGDGGGGDGGNSGGCCCNRGGGISGGGYGDSGGVGVGGESPGQGSAQGEVERPVLALSSRKGLTVSKGALRLLQVNCRSVVNKETQLWNLIEACDADIVLGIESWVSEEILDSEVCRSDYLIFRRGRQTRGGGVSLFALDHL